MNQEPIAIFKPSTKTTVASIQQSGKIVASFRKEPTIEQGQAMAAALNPVPQEMEIIPFAVNADGEKVYLHSEVERLRAWLKAALSAGEICGNAVEVLTLKNSELQKKLFENKVEQQS